MHAMQPISAHRSVHTSGLDGCRAQSGTVAVCVGSVLSWRWFHHLCLMLMPHSPCVCITAWRTARCKLASTVQKSSGHGCHTDADHAMCAQQPQSPQPANLCNTWIKYGHDHHNDAHQALYAQEARSAATGGPAPAAAPPTDPIAISVSEKVMVALNKDGGVRELEVSGIMALQVLLCLPLSSSQQAWPYPRVQLLPTDPIAISVSREGHGRPQQGWRRA